MDSAKRVISGTFGSCWLEGEKVGECSGLQAKVAFNKEKINLDGQMAEDVKVTSTSCTGSLKLHKVNSRMTKLIGKKIQNGEDVRFTLISQLKDPDSYGSERVAIYNVSFDDLTLADWERAQVGKVESPFTFTRYEMLDSIAAQ